MKPTDFAYHLTRYLAQYLPARVGSSGNTVQSYRDTFALLLRFCADVYQIPPERITLAIMTKDRIESFLDWTEAARGCSIATRNQRLAGIHAFVRYLQMESPEHLYLCQQILAIKQKRNPRKAFAYLTLDGIKAVLSAPDTMTLSGRRDLVMLSLLYDTGARVQEIADSVVSDVRLEAPATIRLTGKGQKTRIVPLMTPTTKLLDQFLSETGRNSMVQGSHPLFPNRSGAKLTRAGITYILKKYADQARLLHPELIPKTISPHCFRHSKAMHLLQAGVNLIYIRDLLGHVSITTTEVYARADSQMKRSALEHAYSSVPSEAMPIWQKNTNLLQWLKGLGK